MVEEVAEKEPVIAGNAIDYSARLEKIIARMREEATQKEEMWEKKKNWIVEEEEDKKVIFNSLALGIKMVMPKEVLKIDNTMLYNECRGKNIPIKDWNFWLVETLSNKLMNMK